MNISPFVDPILGTVVLVGLVVGNLIDGHRIKKILRRMEDLEAKLNGIDRKTVSKSAAPSKPGIRIRLH